MPSLPQPIQQDKSHTILFGEKGKWGKAEREREERRKRIRSIFTLFTPTTLPAPFFYELNCNADPLTQEQQNQRDQNKKYAKNYTCENKKKKIQLNCYDDTHLSSNKFHSRHIMINVYEIPKYKINTFKLLHAYACS